MQSLWKTRTLWWRLLWNQGISWLVGKDKLPQKPIKQGSGQKQHKANIAASDAPAQPFTLNQTQYEQLISMLSSHKPTDSLQFSGKVISNSSSWILDSGASEHTTPNHGLLTSTHAPNGANMKVESIGMAKISASMELNKVFYVPEFNCNLMSVSQPTNDVNCVVTFYPSFCTSHDLATRRLIGMGEQCNGLYYFKAVKTSLAATAKSDQSSILGQMRLGHSPFHKLLQIPQISSSSFKGQKHCDSCLRAKQKTFPFKFSLFYEIFWVLN